MGKIQCAICRTGIRSSAAFTQLSRNMEVRNSIHRQYYADQSTSRLELRPLEGFVYAISPFNFTAIGGNLVAAPALMGNVVLWKPSDYAIASNWLLYNILLEAGLPPNVIQWIPGDPVAVTETVLASKHFAALHYTGSTAVFRQLQGKIGTNFAEGKYRDFPRVVGETGGKNYHLLHHSADVKNAAANTVRGAFEYQGQKCSATSRAYVPQSLWPAFSKELVEATKTLEVGAPTSAANFIGPLIHKVAYERVSGAIEAAKKDPELELLVGGDCDSSKGWFVHPTVFQTTNPGHWIMKKELFGPVLAVYVYDDSKSSGIEPAKDEAFLQVCELVDKTSEYGLTGSIFATNRAAVRVAEDKLRYSAGNFYINCKSTGAVVGQQPFGGSRASGTNEFVKSSHDSKLLLTR
jgi:1-pyrroline-5-carboxylate dehydrogenase